MNRPEDGTCRNCKKFSSHNIVNNTYVCPNCGFVTPIPTWEEVEKELNDMAEFWQRVEKEHPNFFRPERQRAIKDLKQTVKNFQKSSSN